MRTVSRLVLKFDWFFYAEWRSVDKVVVVVMQKGPTQFALIYGDWFRARHVTTFQFCFCFSGKPDIPVTDSPRTETNGQKAHCAADHMTRFIRNGTIIPNGGGRSSDEVFSVLISTNGGEDEVCSVLISTNGGENEVCSVLISTNGGEDEVCSVLISTNGGEDEVCSVLISTNVVKMKCVVSLSQQMGVKINVLISTNGGEDEVCSVLISTNGVKMKCVVSLSRQMGPTPRVADTTLNGSNGSTGSGGRPRFVAVTSLEDVQAVRCAEFHPQGKLYAVGSNSKTLRICSYPKLSDLREDHATYQPTVLFKRTKHHKGSIYCLAWTPIGDLMATGSNDKTVKLMRFNVDTSNLEGQETELTMHDGTVRDLCFLEDTSNKSSLLISGGAGDCKIYVTDCATGTPFQALSGHSGAVLSLYNWGGAMFVSGSQDKTVRFWDLRTRGCVNMVTPATVPGSLQGSPVATICVDPSGRLLVSGHDDSSCVLFDIRGGRSVQCFKPHSLEVRSIRFSPSAYYLLTGGYDQKLVLTDLQGDLTMSLPSVVVAQHQDKVISGRWHPTEFAFLSTSADKTATLWALPPV
uniref:WD repeat-containing protein 47 n=1 Tax=Timema tahoe TaxID=61484 RepID=A0A7R9FLY8_9NEOP|nr:unnamed protein product [Timema tahoe]